MHNPALQASLYHPSHKAPAQKLCWKNRRTTDCDISQEQERLTSEVADVRLFLKPQPLCPAMRVQRMHVRFLTLAHTAYGACPNSLRLRARRLGNPPKSRCKRLDWPRWVGWRGSIVQMAKHFFCSPSQRMSFKFREVSFELLTDFLVNLNTRNKDHLSGLSKGSGEFKEKRLMGR